MQQGKALWKLKQVKKSGEHCIPMWGLMWMKIFLTGDNVYYGRQNYKGWHGSAKVLDKECLNLLIRFGGAFYRMYPWHLMKVNNKKPKNLKSTKNIKIYQMK